MAIVLATIEMSEEAGTTPVALARAISAMESLAACASRSRFDSCKLNAAAGYTWATKGIMAVCECPRC